MLVRLVVVAVEVAVQVVQHRIFLEGYGLVGVVALVMGFEVSKAHAKLSVSLPASASMDQV